MDYINDVDLLTHYTASACPRCTELAAALERLEKVARILYCDETLSVSVQDTIETEKIMALAQARKALGGHK